MVLCGFFLAHLVWAYIYSDGKYIGLPGGSVSVGVVSGSRPQPLNPFLYGSGNIDDMIYNLMFRGLIRYNSETEIFEWDLAYCDIKDISKIQCKLTDDAIWSDGSSVTNDDVIATFNAFKENAGDADVKAALTKASIKTDADNTIIIESPSKDPSIIEAMSYPILRSDVIDQLKNNRLKKESYITSGPFIFSEATDDTEYNYYNIALEKNPNYKKTVWLDKFRIRIFPDLATLQRGINTVEIIIPPASQEKMNLSKGYTTIPYANYEFFWNFFQTNRMDANLRASLLTHLALRFKESAPEIEGYIPVNSLFLSGAEITGKKTSMDLATFMSEKWYKKKDVLLAEATAINTIFSGSATIPKLKYFKNGNSAAILYSDDPAWEISLYGKVPASTTSVTINNYTLREYSAGNTDFVYKITTNTGTLKNGKNIYELKLSQKDGSTLSETLTIYHTTDSATMKNYQNEVEASLVAEMNTPEKIAEREAQKQQKITEINALEDNVYYNSSYEPFSLVLAFLSDNTASVKYAEFTIQELATLGIKTETKPLTTKELDALIKSGEKNYDMIILWVRSPWTVADLGSSFFSSENGNPNFANISSKNFVADFESLKNISDQQLANETELKIINFINEHNFYLPISQPEHIIYVHGDVKGFNMPKIIGDISSLASVVDTVSKKDEYQLNSNKSFSGFFTWFWQKISLDKK